MKQFAINEIDLSKYLFFTEKGGVGKTSTACTSTISLADMGKEVLLISTDLLQTSRISLKLSLTTRV